MQIEQTILVVGCQQSVLDILGDTFKNSGIQIVPATYAYQFNDNIAFNAVLIYLNEKDIDSARQFLAQNAVTKMQRILIINPRNQALRLFSATVDIDDVVFKPVRVQELVARVQLITQRENIRSRNKFSICDELDFAQKMHDFADEKFTGCLHLKGQELESEVFFENGIIRGIRAERKIQNNAVDALWRIFPANHSVEKSVSLPIWAENEAFSISAKELVSRVIDAASFFHDKFADKYSLHTVFRISNSQYDRAFPKLPRQVRQIVQTFDGSRALFEVLNTLNLSEMLTMQIILRLLQENLIRECRPCNESVSLAEWIHSDSMDIISGDNDELDEESRITSKLSVKSFSENNEIKNVEEATPSVVMFIEQLNKTESKTDASLQTNHNVEKESEIVQALSDSNREDENVKCSIAYSLLSGTSDEKDKTAAVSNLLTAMLDNSGKIEEHNRNLPEPLLAEIAIQPGKPHSDYISVETESDSARTDEFVQPDISKTEKIIAPEHDSIAYKNQSADLVDEYSTASDLDSAVTADYVMPFRHASDLESDVTARIDVVDYINKESKLKDENKTEELSADIVVPEKIKLSSSDDDGDESYDDSDWFNDDSDKDTLRLTVDDSFSAEALYKENHKDEISPSEWKSSVLKRLDNESKARDKLIMGILIAAIVVAAAVLIGILFSGSEKSSNHSAQIPSESTDKKNSKSADVPNVLPAHESIEHKQPIVVDDENDGLDKLENDIKFEQESLEMNAPEGYIGNALNSVENIKDVENNPLNDSNAVLEGQPIQVEESVPAPVVLEESVPAPVVAEESASSPEPRLNPSRKSDDAQSGRKNAAPETKSQQNVSNHSASKNSSSLNVMLQPVRDAINRKDWNSAFRELKPLLDKNPNNKTMLNMAVQILMRQNKFEQALEYSKKLESSSGSKHTYWMQRAKILKSLGQTNEADQAIDKAIAIVGENSLEGERYKAQKTNKEPLKPMF